MIRGLYFFLKISLLIAAPLSIAALVIFSLKTQTVKATPHTTAKYDTEERSAVAPIAAAYMRCSTVQQYSGYYPAFGRTGAYEETIHYITAPGIGGSILRGPNGYYANVTDEMIQASSEKHGRANDAAK